MIFVINLVNHTEVANANSPRRAAEFLPAPGQRSSAKAAMAASIRSWCGGGTLAKDFAQTSSTDTPYVKGQSLPNLRTVCSKAQVRRGRLFASSYSRYHRAPPVPGQKKHCESARGRTIALRLAMLVHQILFVKVALLPTLPLCNGLWSRKDVLEIRALSKNRPRKLNRYDILNSNVPARQSQASRPTSFDRVRSFLEPAPDMRQQGRFAITGR